MKFDKICVNSDTGHISGTGNNLVIVTRAQWEDYVSSKIRVGDKVKIEYAGTNGEVLCVGNRTVFIRLDDGHELSTAPEYITRIPQ